MNAVRVMSDRELDLIRTSSRRDAIGKGIAIGIALAVVVCGVVGIGLDAFRARLYDGRIKAAVAEESARTQASMSALSSCEDKLVQFAAAQAVAVEMDRVAKGRD